MSGMNKQVLDITQMQHLQELGLKLKETMLYWVVYEVGHENSFVTTKENAMEVIDESCGMLPAYTLQDVLDALPIEIKYKDKRCWLCIELADEMIGYYYENARFEHRWVYYEVVMIDESLIDAACRLLIWVIENGYISKLPVNKNSK